MVDLYDEEESVGDEMEIRIGTTVACTWNKGLESGNGDVQSE